MLFFIKPVLHFHNYSELLFILRNQDPVLLASKPIPQPYREFMGYLTRGKYKDAKVIVVSLNQLISVWIFFDCLSWGCRNDAAQFWTKICIHSLWFINWGLVQVESFVLTWSFLTVLIRLPTVKTIINFSVLQVYKEAHWRYSGVALIEVGS